MTPVSAERFTMTLHATLRGLAALLILAGGVGARPAWPEPVPGASFFVAPGGSDANPGDRDRPFATLARARDAVRTLRQTGTPPPGGVAVFVLLWLPPNE